MEDEMNVGWLRDRYTYCTVEALINSMWLWGTSYVRMYIWVVVKIMVPFWVP